MCAPSKLDCRVIVYCNDWGKGAVCGTNTKGCAQTTTDKRTARMAEPLSVRLLVAGTSRRTSVLLGLAATRIYPSIVHPTSTSGNQGAVVFHEDVLDLTLVLFDDV